MLGLESADYPSYLQEYSTPSCHSALPSRSEYEACCSCCAIYHASALLIGSQSGTCRSTVKAATSPVRFTKQQGPSKNEVFHIQLRASNSFRAEHAMPLAFGIRQHRQPGQRRVHAAIAVTAITALARLQTSSFAYPVPRMQGSLIEPEQCEEIAYDCWERARVDENITSDQFDKVRTVFGYGSLIFRPGFPYQRMYPACVRGYLRRFWQMSCDHRGTPEFPGFPQP